MIKLNLTILLFACGVLYGQPQSYSFLAPVPQRVTQGTAVSVGIAGNSTYYYWVVARYPVGNSFPGGPFAVFNAPNVLNSTNYVKFGFTLTGASSYDILRTTTPFVPSSGSCTCLVVSGDTTGNYSDQGASPTSYTIATTNYVNGNWLLNNQDYATPRYVITPSTVQSLTFAQICFLDLTCQTSASAGGTVASVFGRVGAVVAQTGDYQFNQLGGTALSNQGGTGFASYAKGDLLIGTLSGLVKFTVCPNTQSMVADSSQASGWACQNTGTGTVSSVGVTLPGTVFSSTGSPVTNAGVIAFNFTSQSDGTYLGAPNGGGTPSFRTIPYSAIIGTPSGLPPTGSASGDLSGSYPNPTVARINGNGLGATTPISGNMLFGDGSNWVTRGISGDITFSSLGVGTLINTGVTANTYGDATHVGQFVVDSKGRIISAASVAITGTGGGGPPSGPAGGDLSSTYPNPTVAKINGSALGSTTPNNGALLIGNGTQWNSIVPTGDVTITGTGSTTVAKITNQPIQLNSVLNFSTIVANGAQYNTVNFNNSGRGSTAIAADGGGGMMLSDQRVYDVIEYGAKNDCTGNSTTAFQNAINDAQNYDPTVSTTGSGGGFVRIRGGCYNIAGTLTIGNGSSSQENQLKPVFIYGTSTGDTLTKTKGVELRWTGGNQGSTTYMIQWNGPYIGGGMSNLFLNMQNATNVLAILAMQTANQVWSQINIWQGASGPQITCDTWKTFSNGCFQNTDLNGISVSSPGTNGEGIYLTGHISGTDTHGARFSGGSVSGTNYGVRLGYADNNVFHRMEFHTINAGTSTICSIKFDRGASINAAFPLENVFEEVSPSSGFCGDTGTGAANILWPFTAGDCSQNCDPSTSISSGTELMAIDSITRNLWGVGQVTSIMGAGNAIYHLGKVPNSLGGVEIFRMQRGGAGGNGITFNTFDDFQFTMPNALRHRTDSNTDGNLYLDMYNGGSASARYGIIQRRARGTFASPSTIVTGDRLNVQAFEGYTGSSFFIGGAFETIADIVSPNLTASMRFKTSDNNVLSDVLKLNAYGGWEFSRGRTKSELDTLAAGALAPNGSVWYCTDCNHASSPCTSGGTGGIAKRLGGAWQCN